MSQTDANGLPDGDQPGAERGELVELDVADRGDVEVVDVEATESVTAPAKVMRIGSMVKQLLEGVAGPARRGRPRAAGGDLRAHDRRGIRRAVARPARGTALAGPALPTRVVPSEAELRVAKAQLVGWLEGLFHGIQATFFAQQFAARQQFEQIRQLPCGPRGRPRTSTSR